MSRKERLGFWLLRGIAYFVVLTVGYIVFDIVVKGTSSLTPAFLMPGKPGDDYSIFPAILGTFYLVAGTIVVALPLGMAAAIFLTEYAKQGRYVRIIRLAIVTLAGVPSIVFGVFGVGLFVIFFKFDTSILSGSLTLACMVLPTIIVASEEALRAVPRSLREASLALGATQWETIWKNVLPYSVPGMLTGSILGIGRAAGETAPILFTCAAFYKAELPSSILDSCMALPYHLYVLATQYPESQEIRNAQYGTALVLLILVLGVNIGAIFLRSHFRKRYRW
ncbi:MAG: phosphate transport system permease protein PstA [Candidatus Hydrogenedentota bacterium]